LPEPRGQAEQSRAVKKRTEAESTTKGYINYKKEAVMTPKSAVCGVWINQREPPLNPIHFD